MHELVHGAPTANVVGRKTRTMPRAKKDPTAAPKPKMSLEDKIALLKAQKDPVIQSALGAVEQVFEAWEASKVEMKRNARRLRKLIAGLTAGD